MEVTKTFAPDSLILDTINMINTIDRPEKFVVEGIYSGSGTYAEANGIPKAGAYAEAGVGRVRAELSVLEAEAKGPNASASAEASVLGVGAHAEAGVGCARAGLSVLEAEAKGPNASAGAGASVFGAKAMVQAEVGSVSAKAGPLGVKLGLAADTGASVGPEGLEVKFLGTGIKLGEETSVSLFGSEVSCSVM